MNSPRFLPTRVLVALPPGVLTRLRAELSLLPAPDAQGQAADLAAVDRAIAHRQRDGRGVSGFARSGCALVVPLPQPRIARTFRAASLTPFVPPMMTRRLVAFSCAAVLLVSACQRDRGGDIRGTLLYGTGADVETLVPIFVRGAQAAIVTDLLCDHLADVGPAMVTVGDVGFVPELAQSWTWNTDSSAVTFHLNPKARWHNDTPVLGEDVAYTFGLLRDSATASPNGPDLAIIDSVRASATDSLSATVYFNSRQADRFYWVAKSLVPMPKSYYASVKGRDWDTSPLARHPVCSGPYKFVSWAPKLRLDLEAVSNHYRLPPHIAHVTFVYRGDASTGATSTLVGELDVWEGITRALLAKAGTNPTTQLVPLPAFDYTFVAFNVADPATGKLHPLLGDSALRRALTLASNPTIIRRNIWGDTLARALVGPVVSRQFTYDPALAPLPSDTAAADALLDSLGWRRGADGMRAKGGRKLALKAIVPAPAKPRLDAIIVLQAQWKARGIALTFDALEFQAFLDRQKKRQFDLTVAGWRTQPTPFAILTTWGKDGLTRGVNLAGWTSATVAAHLDSARTATDVPTIKRQFAAVYANAVQNPPALWLYEPAPQALLNRRLRVPTFTTAAWWRTIPQWTIDPAQALPRDRERTP